MRELYFECFNGAAGDMLVSALYDLLDVEGKRKFLENLKDLDFLHAECFFTKEEKMGIYGYKFHVSVKGQEEYYPSVTAEKYQFEPFQVYSAEQIPESENTHAHGYSLQMIQAVTDNLAISSDVKENVQAVYELLAEAEAYVHQTTPEQIHFHEVGEIDAVIDITACALLLEQLAVRKITCSPVTTGYGYVHARHGVLPVPAPATAYLLRDIPTQTGDVEDECCTPTGAALLKFYAQDFGTRPAGKIRKIGYGMGTKDFPKLNCVRAFLLETPNKSQADSLPFDMEDDIITLQADMDDVTGEDLAYALGLLLKAGAKDAYLEQIIMKKGRPGYILNCLCREEDVAKFVKLIFLHTPTIGIRQIRHKRYCLPRAFQTVNTSFGKLTIKQTKVEDIKRYKIEHDDLERIAAQEHISVYEVRKKIKKELST